jgi:hypothetical protein
MELSDTSPPRQSPLSPPNKRKKMQQFIIGDKILELEYVSDLATLSNALFVCREATVRFVGI